MAASIWLWTRRPEARAQIAGTLLLNPVPRREFLIGKFLAVFAFTLMATFLATAFFLVLLGVPCASLHQHPPQRRLGRDPDGPWRW